MDGYLWWTIVGMTLIIAELLTGTFYLIVLGLAALAGAAASYLNFSFGLQAVIAAAIATVGVVVVNHYRVTQKSQSSADNALDIGQSVVLDSWIDRKDGLARVRYRNALWDARVLDEPNAEAGSLFYIQNVDGNTLHVSKAKPA